MFQPSVIPVHTLLAQERHGPGLGTKSLQLLSTCESEPTAQTFDLEIVQPPTREDWICGIREAVDAGWYPDEDGEDIESRVSPGYPPNASIIQDYREPE